MTQVSTQFNSVQDYTNQINALSQNKGGYSASSKWTLNCGKFSGTVDLTTFPEQSCKEPKISSQDFPPCLSEKKEEIVSSQSTPQIPEQDCTQPASKLDQGLIQQVESIKEMTNLPKPDFSTSPSFSLPENVKPSLLSSKDCLSPEMRDLLRISAKHLGCSEKEADQYVKLVSTLENLTDTIADQDNERLVEYFINHPSSSITLGISFSDIMAGFAGCKDKQGHPLDLKPLEASRDIYELLRSKIKNLISPGSTDVTPNASDTHVYSLNGGEGGHPWISDDRMSSGHRQIKISGHNLEGFLVDARSQDSTNDIDLTGLTGRVSNYRSSESEGWVSAGGKQNRISIDSAVPGVWIRLGFNDNVIDFKNPIEHYKLGYTLLADTNIYNERTKNLNINVVNASDVDNFDPFRPKTFCSIQCAGGSFDLPVEKRLIAGREEMVNGPHAPVTLRFAGKEYTLEEALKAVGIY